MEQDARLYHCARCHCQVIICSHCDRGNIYCCSCAPLAHQESLRAAGRRYQNTHRGKLKHAQRQRLYQQRQTEKKIKMTHMGYFPKLNEFSLKKRNKPEKRLVATNPDETVCHFCAKRCRELLRSEFLRDRGYQNTGMTWPLRL